MDDLFDIVRGVSQGIGSIGSQHKHLKSQTEIEYQPPQGPDTWRWTKPPDGLGLRSEQSEELSSLYITPDSARKRQIFALIGGSALIGLALFTAISGMFTGPFGFSGNLFLVLLILGSMGSLGLAVPFLNSYLGQIDLGPDHIKVHVYFGFKFKRSSSISHKKFSKYTLSIKAQSALAKERGQRDPLIYMNLKKKRNPFLLYLSASAKRWVLISSLTQAKWIKEGLTHWGSLNK